MREGAPKPELQTISDARQGRLKPEILMPIPPEQVLKNLLGKETLGQNIEEDVAELTSKYYQIAREIIQRLVFPVLEENIESRSAQNLGISQDKLAKLRKELSELRPVEDGSEQGLEEALGKNEIEREQFDDLIRLIEAGTSPETQHIFMDVIRQQTENFIPYALNRAKLELDLEKGYLIDRKTGALNHEGIEQRFKIEAMKLNNPQIDNGHDVDPGENTKCMLLVEFDIDKFKIVNDDPARGHAVGDEILKEVIKNLKQWLRPSDAVGRHGGDEFAVIINDVNEHDVQIIETKIQNAISTISDRAGGTISITGAIRVIRRGEKTTYKQASEDADVAASIGKILYEGSLVRYPLDIKIDANDEGEKERFAQAIVARRIKREKNLYRQEIEKTEDPKVIKAYKRMIDLLERRSVAYDVKIELQKMEARHGIYEKILS
ncbi:MAG TPA: hypothetical protein DCS29_04570 [Candidatus Magasanikbacteria bacterium]|nr:MAG: hypothetical protein A2479_03030 [Candidatus Magasanikbacteria bacterium RIFOXYC2_FULL_39_8]HAT04014.1 hypothetical protein [Candidatus Magasanikbacteria bacterium]